MSEHSDDDIEDKPTEPVFPKSTVDMVAAHQHKLGYEEGVELGVKSGLLLAGAAFVVVMGGWYLVDFLLSDDSSSVKDSEK